MKKMKKIIAALSAVAMLLTSGIQVWATENVKTVTVYDPLPQSVYPSDETSGGNHVKMQNVTYTSKYDSNVKYVIETEGDSYVMMMNANSDNNGGTKSLRIYGKGTNISGTNTSAKISMFLGTTQTEDNQYVVSFDAYRKDGTWLDYVALNEGGNDGIARLDDAGTQWAKTVLGTGYDAGYSVGEWSRYEATLTTMNEPQLNFSVSGYGILFIDNIIVKDTTGNVIYTEDFEGFEVEETEEPDEPGETAVGNVLPESVYPSNETSSAEHVKMQNITYTSKTHSNMKYVIETEGDSYVMMMNANSDNNGGTKSLRIYGKGTNISGKNTSAKISMFLGIQTADNQYVVSFDAYRKDGTWLDYTALNEGGNDGVARFDNAETQWTKTTLGTGYDAGYSVGEWSRYEATLSTMNAPQLNFSVNEYGILFIDNIVVKDTAGNVIFSEDFEAPAAADDETPDTPEDPDETEEVYDPLPKSVYPSDETSGATHVKMQNVTYTSSRNQDAKYVIETEGDSNAMVMNANSPEGDGTKSLRIYGKGTNISGKNSSAKVSMFIGTQTADNQYVISFDAYRKDPTWLDYVALNEGGHDGVARLNDEACQWTKTILGTGYDAGYSVGEWSRYEATLSTVNEPQINFSVNEYGVLFIDNIVVKDSNGNVIFKETFETTGAEFGESTVVPEQPEQPEEKLYDPLPESVYPSDETSGATHVKMQNITYTSSRNENAKYVIETEGDSYVMIMNANSPEGDGTKSLRIYGKGTNISGKNTSAKVSMFIGTQTADNEYVISFDIHRVYDDWRDYIALNEDGHDGYARLDDADCQWTVTSLGTGYDAGYSVGEWSRYEATLSTVNAPQLNFSVCEWGVMYIDNIVVKDTAGNVIFKETFEDTGAEFGESALPDDPEDPGETEEVYDPLPKSVYPSNETSSAEHAKMQNVTYTSSRNENVKYVVETEGDSYVMVMNANSDTSGGTKSLRIYGKGTNISGKNTSAKISLFLGTQTEDNQYVVSFDAHRVYDDWRDYVALNEDGHDGYARIDDADCQWTVTPLGTGYDAGYSIGEWSRYEATLSTVNAPQLNFSVCEWGVIFIDNIVVKDTAGKVIFREDFETTPEEVIEFSCIYDPKFEVVEQVGDEYQVIETATNLTAGTLLMTSVRALNESDPNTISAVVFTALYKDDHMVSVDVQEVAAPTGGEMTSSTVFEIPSLDDGEYMVKVFVWDSYSNLIPLKAGKILVE